MRLLDALGIPYDSPPIGSPLGAIRMLRKSVLVVGQQRPAGPGSGREGGGDGGTARSGRRSPSITRRGSSPTTTHRGSSPTTTHRGEWVHVLCFLACALLPEWGGVDRDEFYTEVLMGFRLPGIQGQDNRKT